MEQKINESPENLPEPGCFLCRVCCRWGQERAGGAECRRGLGPVGAQCILGVSSSLLSWVMSLLLVLVPSVDTCLTRTCDHRGLDVICHQDLVEQELPVTGSAQAPSWVVTSAPSFGWFFPPCFCGASDLFCSCVQVPVSFSPGDPGGCSTRSSLDSHSHRPWWPLHTGVSGVWRDGF